MEKLYLLLVRGAVEIDLRGPFETESNRLETAQAIYRDEVNPFNCDQVFQLTIVGGLPQVAAYFDGDLETCSNPSTG